MDLVAGSLMKHYQGKHGVGWGYQGQLQPPYSPGGEAETYQGRIPGKRDHKNQTLGSLVHHHGWDKIVILEEGNPPYPC